jgi:hypothetical protein
MSNYHAAQASTAARLRAPRSQARKEPLDSHKDVSEKYEANVAFHA